MLSIPELEMDRLLLRGWQEQDLDPFATMLANPEVSRFIGGEMSRSDAWRGIATMLGHWALRGFGYWAVERKDDGAFIGRIGLWQPEGWPGMEVGYILDKPFWGHGYATEASKASMEFGFSNFPFPKIISLIHPDNRLSQKVAERLGETKGGSTTITLFGKSYDVDVWEISRGDWSANQG